MFDKSQMSESFDVPAGCSPGFSLNVSLSAFTLLLHYDNVIYFNHILEHK